VLSSINVPAAFVRPLTLVPLPSAAPAVVTTSMIPPVLFEVFDATGRPADAAFAVPPESGADVNCALIVIVSFATAVAGR
jgi:hypothetical protein